MGEIEGVEAPGRTGLGIGLAQPYPEKGELVAEGLPLLRGQVTGIIPPFGFKVRVGGVVPGKDIFPARQGQAEFLGGLGGDTRERKMREVLQ